MTRLGTALRITTARAALAVLAVATLGSFGCASSAPLGTRAGGERDVEIARLKDRVLELQRRLSVTEVELARLRREVARMNGTPITEPPPAAAPAERQEPPPARSADRSTPGAAAGATPSSAANRGTADRGFEIEDIEEPAPAPPAGPPQAVEESPGRVHVQPPAPEPAPAAGTAASGTEAAAAEPASTELTQEAQALYDRGYALYHQGRFVDAESTFQQFLQSYGGTELADNAQYWIGEARFARGDMKGALAAFREVARRFPQGNKVPDALLKAGETQAAAGDAAGARATYRDVVRRFPGTRAASVAQDRLADLG